MYLRLDSLCWYFKGPSHGSVFSSLQMRGNILCWVLADHECFLVFIISLCFLWRSGSKINWVLGPERMCVIVRDLNCDQLTTHSSSTNDIDNILCQAQMKWTHWTNNNQNSFDNSLRTLGYFLHRKWHFRSKSANPIYYQKYFKAAIKLYIWRCSKCWQESHHISQIIFTWMTQTFKIRMVAASTAHFYCNSQHMSNMNTTDFVR